MWRARAAAAPCHRRCACAAASSSSSSSSSATPAVALHVGRKRALDPWRTMKRTPRWLVQASSAVGRRRQQHQAFGKYYYYYKNGFRGGGVHLRQAAFFSTSPAPDDSGCNEGGGGERTTLDGIINDSAYDVSYDDDETDAETAVAAPTEPSISTLSEEEFERSLGGMSAEQAHVARQQRERQLRLDRTAERIRRHEERVAADVEAAESREAERGAKVRRAHAARAVPFLMASRRDVYERTMGELNLASGGDDEADSLGADGEGAGGGGDGEKRRRESIFAEGPAEGTDAGGGGVQSHYRAIYMDSVPSFGQILVDDPASVVVAALGGTTAEAEDDEVGNNEPTLSDTERLLDDLADAGFADPKFTKAYRKMKRSREMYGHAVERTARKARTLDARTRKLDELRAGLIEVGKELEEAERRVARLEKEEEELARMSKSSKKGGEGGDGGQARDVDRQQQQASPSPTTTTAPFSPIVETLREGVSKMFGLGSQLVGDSPQKEEAPVPAADIKEMANASDDDEEEDSDKADKYDSELSPSAELVKTRRAVRRLQRRAEKGRLHVQQAEDAVRSTTKQIQKLEAQREQYRPTLTDEQYEAASAVAGRVLAALCPAFAAHLNARHAEMIERYRILDAQTDLTKPHEWYPRARLDRRRIVFHGGPTNSGKTYTALRRLEEAGRGMYLGPLRLLAAEIYEDLTTRGVYANLYTGQEKRVVPFATHSAATVEMCPLDEDFDVVVIDEIQMITDPFRGFAWTRALLGVRCKEIHVCGGMEARPLVEKIAEFCGDDFELNEYERFSPLKVLDESLADRSDQKGSYRAVRPGDCVVAFSRNDIFAIKREIERTTDYKCCVIYGSLPPQTRSDQARRFNDPDSGYDILVASDAIGMGLNLSIKRIIFNSMFKSNGERIVQLDHSAVKQISGRAGRRNSPFPFGEVTCRDPVDMDHLRKCMGTEIVPITKAGLLPTSNHFEMFAAATEKYDDAGGGDSHSSLHKILLQFEEMARMKGGFFLCKQTQIRLMAEWLDDLPLPLTDKYNFCMAPVNETSRNSMAILKNFAQKYAFGEMSGLKRNVLPKAANSFEDLSRLCSTHHELELFLWLCFRFPGNMMEQQVANTLKEKTISAINEGLGRAGKLGLDHCYIRRDKNLRASWAQSRDDPDSDDYHDFVHDLDKFDDTLPRFEVEEI